MKLFSISAAENEYFAEQTIVTIVSAIDHPVFRFLSGSIGPLEAGLPCEVPLWLAIRLRHGGLCTINVPDWLRPEFLEKLIETERESDIFGEIDFHYIEIFQLLGEYAREDIPQFDRVAALLQDVQNIRMDRAKFGIEGEAKDQNIDDRFVCTQLKNISSAEITLLKGFLIEYLNTVEKYRQTTV